MRDSMLAAALLLAGPAAAAPGGDQLWRFYADFAVTLVEAVPDLSGNGGKDMLVGSGDDTLYLVEGRGTGKGAQLWAAPFRSTVSAATLLGDVTGDGKPDAFGGDELGFMQAVNGATGASLWKFLSFGTVIAAAGVPDTDGDGAPDVLVGSENDTLYCLSGKTPTALGKVLWQFGAPPKRGRGGGPGGPPGKVSAAAAGPKDGITGVNAVGALMKGNDLHGLVAGASNDTVYCFGKAGTPIWKTSVDGDAWDVAAFPDMDGDGIQEALVASGLDIAYLLKGSTGEVLWSRAVSMGAISVAAAGDMTGDGKADALIGDGGGKVHCVSGAATGSKVAAAWTYDFADTSTIHSIAALGDVDGDGKADCAVGTSHDLVALITGKGTRAWQVNMGGTVFSVANLGDLDGNGADDVGAGTEMGFAAAYQGFGPTSSRLSLAPAGSRTRPWARTLRLSSGSGHAFGPRDLRGRAAFPSASHSPRPGKGSR